MTNNITWWKGAVIYQIYPRSFKDSNSDGIGDLAGITSKLDYIASLNVDAIWLSPFFTSPMKDFGYDVSDYCGVDPLFGTIEDFQDLVAKAHQLGLKVIIDQVYSHTSDQHAWFQESRVNKTNPKADWYVWADPKPDGTPPNNWLSLFGGSAWQWDTPRQQYFLHNFLASQPDLNFHNVEVQDAILNAAKFWLDLGVDGFRLDVVNMYFHDKALVDNGVADSPEKMFVGVDPNNPFSKQHHVHQMCRDDNLEFLKRLRKLLDLYPGSTTVGEIGAPDGLSYMAQYTSDGNKLHMAYTFELLNEKCDPLYLKNNMMSIKPVRKKLTVKSVAEILGVSTATVSNAFNRPDQLSSELRLKILEECTRIGYHGPNPAARSLRTGATGVVGVMLAEKLTYNFSDPCAIEFLEGVSQVLDDARVNMLLMPGREEFYKEKSLESIPERYIIYGPPKDMGLLDRIEGQQKPIVTVDFSLANHLALNIDNYGGAKAAALHVLNTTDGNVAVIGLRLSNKTNNEPLQPADLLDPFISVSRQRLDAYLDASVEAGRPKLCGAKVTFYRR